MGLIKQTFAPEANISSLIFDVFLEVRVMIEVSAKDGC